MIEFTRGENLIDKRTFTLDGVPIARADISAASVEVIQGNKSIVIYNYTDLSSANFRAGGGDNQFVVEIPAAITKSLILGLLQLKYTIERNSSEFTASGKSVSCAIVLDFKAIK